MLEAVAVLTLAGLLVGGLTLWQSRLADQREARLLTVVRDMYDAERTRLTERVAYLEYQLADHTAHVLKLPPPAPPAHTQARPKPLPDMVQKFLDAIDGEEERAEYEADFRARLELGADPAALVSEAMSG